MYENTFSEMHKIEHKSYIMKIEITIIRKSLYLFLPLLLNTDSNKLDNKLLQHKISF